MKLQMKINSETQVTEEAEFKTFGCSSAIASSSLANEWVKGKTSRKHGHQEHGYRPRDQPSLVQPCSMQQNTPELGGGYT